MSRLKRTQLILQTWEGELVTSTQLTFEGKTNEYITVASLAWLIEADPEEVVGFFEKQPLIMRKRHGQLWVNCSDIIPLLGWTPS